MASDSLAGIRPYKNLTPTVSSHIKKTIKHPEYVENESEWEIVRDCYLGSKRIKERGEQYLPRLSGQEASDYELYKRRALFFPITGKTVSSLSGFATVKPPLLAYPTEMTEFFKESVKSYQFTEILMICITECLLMGRIGVLIDAPQTVGKPYVCTYTAENIVNWKVDDQKKPVWVLLHEVVYEEDPKELFTYNTRHQYRFLSIENGVYTQTILNEDLDVIRTLVPMFSGKSINFIPFCCIGSSGVHFEVDRPPMLDIATINISHYMTSADLEWGRHFTGLPTPVVSGVDGSTVLKIGGTSAWILPPPEANAKYLEFTGQGLLSLEKAMTEKISLMASMSARLVDVSTRGSEAAETVRLRYMAETATLAQILNAVENALNIVYRTFAELINADSGAVKIEIHKDVLSIGLQATELRELFAAYLSGSISKETLVYNLRRGNYLDPERSTEEELAAIRNPPPPAPAPSLSTIPPGK